MKQILNINLGGHPVTIDTDAYEHLSRYLDAIERHFKESDAAEEILSDIETRMAELFKENIHPRTIVTMPDVKAAIDIMGTPEMFGAEVVDDEPVSSRTQQKKQKSGSGFNPGKRLFRNPDDKVIGGVCSGLAAYLGVGDPVWVRIAFIAFTLLGFASVPIYVILWIVMPVAKTSADRLAMRGEPINVESIASSVVDELENISEKLNDKFGSHKKKSGGRSSRRRYQSEQGKDFLEALGGVLSTIIIGVGRIARPILLVLGAVLILALVVGWIGVVVTAGLGIAKAQFFLPTNSFAFSVGAASLFLFIGAPIMGLILTVLRVFFKQDHSIKWRWGLVGLWFLGLFGLSFTATVVTDSYGAVADYEQTVVMPSSKEAPTLKIYKEWVEIANNDARKINFQNENLRFNWAEVQFNIKPAVDNQYKLVQIQTARGSDDQDALEGAKTFEYQPILSDTSLKVPTNYFIPKGERFRVQRVKLTLYVPVGNKIFLDDNMRSMNVSMDEASGVYGNLYGKELVMTDMGVKRVVPHGQPSKSSGYITANGTQVLDLEDFTSIRAKGPVALKIQQGEFFRVKIRGIKDGDPVNLKVEGQELNIDVDEAINKDVEVFITMPKLERFSANQTHDIHLSNFTGHALAVSLEGDMEAKMGLEYKQLEISLGGDALLDLTGHANRLEAHLSDDSVLQGKDLHVRQANVVPVGDAKADVEVDGEVVHFGG